MHTKEVVTNLVATLFVIAEYFTFIDQLTFSIISSVNIDEALKLFSGYF